MSDKRSLLVFDGDGRFVTAMLRPAKRPGGVEIGKFLRRLLRAIRANWPATQILIRADSHYCCPEVIDFCRTNGLDFILGVAPTTTLRRHVEALEVSIQARFEASAKTAKLRRFKEFYDGAASWSRVERIIARVEAGEAGTNTRFIVTNLAGGRPKALYQDLYCRRGCAENHIKSWKTHLAADRTSCSKATANQFRLFLHAGAYWLLWALRTAMPKRSLWRVAQFDTLRLRLVKARPREGGDRNPCGRAENAGPTALADGVSISGDPANRPRALATSRYLTGGALIPATAPVPGNPKNSPYHPPFSKRCASACSQFENHRHEPRTSAKTGTA